MIEHLIQSNSTPTKPTTPTNHTNKPNHQMKKIKIPFQLLNQVSRTDILLSVLLKDDTSPFTCIQSQHQYPTYAALYVSALPQ